MATSPFWNLSYLEGATAMPKCNQRHASQPQEPTALFRTPPEMFFAVFKLLAREDIEHIRLVCRHWRVLGAYFLMDRVFFGPRRKIMDNFTAISRHPIFSKSIKKIVYDAALNDASLLALENYKEEYRWYFQTDEEGYQRGLNQYRKLLDDQQAILDTGEDYAVLKAGMDLMPNARRVVVLDHVHDRYFREWYDNKGPGSWDTSPTLWPCSSEHLGRNSRGSSWDLRIIHHVLRAVSLSDTTIETLVLGGGVDDLGAVPLTLTAFNSVDSEHARSAVRSLSTLSIQFKTYSKPTNNFDYSYGSHLEDIWSLVDWLLEAQNLTYLMLEFGPRLDRVESHELLKTAVWPRLRAVRIAGVRCDKSLVVGFRNRHMLGIAKGDIICTESLRNRGGAIEVLKFAQVHRDDLVANPGRYIFSKYRESKQLPFQGI